MTELKEIIEELCKEIGVFSEIASGQGIPSKQFERSVEFLKQIPTLFEKIEHGEQPHREWLNKAINAHFLGLPMPEYS